MPRREASRASAPAPPDGAVTRTPSLVRDLSLIALGLLIVSVIHAEGRARQPRVPALHARPRRCRGVPYVVSRFVYRDYAIRFPWRGGGRWTTFQWTLAGRRAGARLADPAVLLHHLGRLHELAGGEHARTHRATVRRRRRGRHLGRAVLHLHRLRAAAPPLPDLAGEPAAGDRVRVVPVGARLSGVGAAADDPVRAAAGLTSSSARAR